MEIKPARSYFSVVFEIQDAEKFKELAASFSGQMCEQKVKNGAVISACGWGDFATQADAFSRTLEEAGYCTENSVLDLLFLEGVTGDSEENRRLKEIMG